MKAKLNHKGNKKQETQQYGGLGELNAKFTKTGKERIGKAQTTEKQANKNRTAWEKLI